MTSTAEAGGREAVGSPEPARPQSMVAALNSGLRAAMERDPKVVLLGEDIGRLGGVFRVTDGLQKDFGADRVVDTPLGEAGIVGAAIGLAMAGYRPVCEIQFDGFVFPATNQIVTQLAKLHHRTGGQVTLPVVIRIPFGGGIGAIEHHSESPETYFAHTAGLKVLSCSTPNDAHHLIQQAIASPDPVVFLEPKHAYWARGELQDNPDLGMHDARIVRAGSDVTVVAYGAMTTTALEAARIAGEEGRSLEVVDLRTLSPLDMTTVLASVRRTGRLVIVHEASRSHGLGAEIAARTQDEAFYDLEAPVIRVTGYDTPYPPSRLEDEWLPGVDRILDAVDRSLSY